MLLWMLRCMLIIDILTFWTLWGGCQCSRPQWYTKEVLWGVRLLKPRTVIRSHDRTPPRRSETHIKSERIVHWLQNDSTGITHTAAYIRQRVTLRCPMFLQHLKMLAHSRSAVDFVLSLSEVVDGLLLLLYQHLLVYDCQTLFTLCQRDVCCF